MKAPAFIVRRGLFAAAVLLMAEAGLAQESPAPFPEPTSAESLFEERPFGPLPPPTPTPSPRRVVLEDEEPIPKEWWIGGGIALAVALLGVIYGAMRASRSSNLFDRQYRFPEGGEPAYRLGGRRSGGHMAKIRFGEGKRAPASEPEDG